MTVFSPDDHRPWQPSTLQASEHAWLVQQRRDAERTEIGPPPTSRLPGRMRSAVDRLSVETGWIAMGLQHATATIPPPARAPQTRRGSGPSDPTLAVTASTLDTVEQAAARWAHLLDECGLDGTIEQVGLRDDERRVHRCPPGTAAWIADQLAANLERPDGQIAGLLGTPASSTAAWHRAVGAAESWMVKAAATIGGEWLDAWRNGAEEEHLRHTLAATRDLANRTAAIAGTLAAWSGRTERRRCAAGCGAPAPALDPDADQRGGAVCDRCRKQASRARSTG